MIMNNDLIILNVPPPPKFIELIIMHCTSLSGGFFKAKLNNIIQYWGKYS